MAGTIAQGQFHGAAGRADQLHRRGPRFRQFDAVDGEQDVAGLGVGARPGQRRGGQGVRGLSGQDAGDFPAVADELEIRAEAALGAAAVLGDGHRADVGVGGAQLAVQLPQQVHEVIVGAEAFHHRTVAGVDGVPVLAGHVLGPEEVALKPPRLVEGLAPHTERVQLHPDAAEVHLDELAGVLVGFGAGGRNPDLLVLDEHDLGSVAGKPVAVQCLHDRGGAPLGEVVADQAGRGALVLEAGPAFARGAGKLTVQPEEGTGGGGERRIVTLRHGDTDDAVGEALGVDPDGRHRLRGRRSPGRGAAGSC